VPPPRAAPDVAQSLDLRLVGFAAAVWLATLALLGASPPVAFAAAASAGTAAVAGLLLRRAWVPAGAAALAGMAAAGLVTGLRLVERDRQPLAALAAHGAAASAVFVLRDDPRPVAGRGPGAAAVVVPAELQRLDVAGRTIALRARVLVLATDPGWRPLLPSQRVTAEGRLQRARGGDLTAAVLSARGPPQAVSPPSLSQSVAGRLRAGLRHAAVGLPPAERGLLPGLVVGDTSAMDPALTADFRTSGLTHLVAVSGTNCAIVGGAVLLLARRLGLPRRLAAVSAGVALAGFVVLARPSPSVLRAAVMGGIGLVALAAGRPRAAVPALAAAVAGLVLVDPALARSAGFALSVLATGGLLLFAPGWRDRLRRRLPGGLAEAIAVPAAAQLACAPVIAALSGQVSLVAVPANLLAVPAVAPATVLGVLAAAVSPVSPLLAGWLVSLAGWPAGWLVRIARWASGIPGGSLSWPGGRNGGLLLAGLLLAAFVVLRAPAVRRSALAAAVAVTATVLPVRTIAPGWPPPGWLLVACDVGQGDALAVATADGAAVVVDTGPDPAAVDGCLRRLSVTTIPMVVLTHLHADHVGGLAGVLRGRRVGLIAVGPLAEPAAADRMLHVAASASAVPVRPLVAGETYLLGRLRLDVLGPALAAHGTRSDPNNSSVVLRVSAGPHRMLLAGDVEVEAQQLLRATGADVTAEVLKVPHHGSAYQDPAFLRAVGASVALVSVGAGNDYGHPAQRTLAELGAAGMRVLRTDQQGDLAVADPGTGLVAVVRGAQPGRRPRRFGPSRPPGGSLRPGQPVAGSSGAAGPPAPCRGRRRAAGRTYGGRRGGPGPGGGPGSRSARLHRRRTQSRGPPGGGQPVAVRGGAGTHHRRPAGRGSGRRAGCDRPGLR